MISSFRDRSTSLKISKSRGFNLDLEMVMCFIDVYSTIPQSTLELWSYYHGHFLSSTHHYDDARPHYLGRQHFRFGVFGRTLHRHFHNRDDR